MEDLARTDSSAVILKVKYLHVCQNLTDKYLVKSKFKSKLRHSQTYFVSSIFALNSVSQLKSFTLFCCVVEELRIHMCMNSLVYTPSIQGTLLFKFVMSPDKKKNIHFIIENLELFSCSLVNEEGTALSILEPINADLEIKHPQEYRNIRFHRRSSSDKESSSKETTVDAYFLQVTPQFLSICHTV